MSNFYGTSPESVVGNGATLVNGPSVPLSFEEDRARTTGYTVGLSWVEGTDNGGTPVLDYAVWGDQAADDWIQLAQYLTSTSYTALDLTSGTTYKFKVVGRNAHDYGDFTEELSVLAAQMPDTPSAPVTVLDGDNVITSWVAPYNGGSPITGYRIYF